MFTVTMVLVNGSTVDPDDLREINLNEKEEDDFKINQYPCPWNPPVSNPISVNDSTLQGRSYYKWQNNFAKESVSKQEERPVSAASSRRLSMVEELLHEIYHRRSSRRSSGVYEGESDTQTENSSYVVLPFNGRMVLQKTRLVTKSQDTRMKFSVAPGPGDSGFAQWHDAMTMCARLPGGIPQEFRRKLWLTLAEHHLHSCCIDWPRVEKFSFNEWSNPDDDELGDQIVKDLHRTGCSLFCGEDAEDNQAMLKRVLLAYARWNKAVGYCQGFNMLAAIILEVMERQESDAVKVMIYLIEGVLPESYFANNLRGLSVDMAVFRDLLRIRLPQFSRHLECLQHEADSVTGMTYEPPLTNVFTMQWFLTLFSNCLPRETVLRLWDLTFLQGNEVLLRTALAIWDVHASRILEVRSADEFYTVMGSLAHQMAEEGIADDNKFIQKIVTMAPFPFPGLYELRDKYAYNITPWTQSVSSVARKGLRLFYLDDDEEENVDEDHKIAVAAAAFGLGGLFKKGDSGRGPSPVGPISSNSSSSHRSQEMRESHLPNLDISALKKQYARLRERQRQAHIILSASQLRIGKRIEDDSKRKRERVAGSKTVNHLLRGKKALISKTRRVLPQGVTPSKKKERKISAPSSLRSAGLQKFRHANPPRLESSYSGSITVDHLAMDKLHQASLKATPSEITDENIQLNSETLHWKDTPRKYRRSSLPSAVRLLEIERPRDELPDISAEGEDDSSTSTELCDECEHLSDSGEEHRDLPSLPEAASVSQKKSESLLSSKSEESRQIQVLLSFTDQSAEDNEEKVEETELSNKSLEGRISRILNLTSDYRKQSSCSPSPSPPDKYVLDKESNNAYSETSLIAADDFIVAADTFDKKIDSLESKLEADRYEEMTKKNNFYNLCLDGSTTENNSSEISTSFLKSNLDIYSTSAAKCQIVNDLAIVENSTDKNSVPLLITTDICDSAIDDKGKKGATLSFDIFSACKENREEFPLGRQFLSPSISPISCPSNNSSASSPISENVVILHYQRIIEEELSPLNIIMTKCREDVISDLIENNGESSPLEEITSEAIRKRLWAGVKAYCEDAKENFDWDFLEAIGLKKYIYPSPEKSPHGDDWIEDELILDEESEDVNEIRRLQSRRNSQAALQELMNENTKIIEKFLKQKTENEIFSINENINECLESPDDFRSYESDSEVSSVISDFLQNSKSYFDFSKSGLSTIKSSDLESSSSSERDFEKSNAPIITQSEDISHAHQTSTMINFTVPHINTFQDPMAFKKKSNVSRTVSLGSNGNSKKLCFNPFPTRNISKQPNEVTARLGLYNSSKPPFI